MWASTCGQESSFSITNVQWQCWWWGPGAPSALIHIMSTRGGKQVNQRGLCSLGGKAIAQSSGMTALLRGTATGPIPQQKGAQVAIMHPGGDPCPPSSGAPTGTALRWEQCTCRAYWCTPPKSSCLVVPVTMCQALSTPPEICMAQLVAGCSSLCQKCRCNIWEHARSIA